MLTNKNYSLISNDVLRNISFYINPLKEFKTAIQNEIVALITASEKYDIVLCSLNMSVVHKLATLGKKHYLKSDKSDHTLYCICMAIGTIIKEYDWGDYYIHEKGMCELSSMIAE